MADPATMAEFVVWLYAQGLAEPRRQEMHAEVDRFAEWRSTSRHPRPVDLSGEIWCYMTEPGRPDPVGPELHTRYLSMNLLLAFVDWHS